MYLFKVLEETCPTNSYVGQLLESSTTPLTLTKKITQTEVLLWCKPNISLLVLQFLLTEVYALCFQKVVLREQGSSSEVHGMFQTLKISHKLHEEVEPYIMLLILAIFHTMFYTALPNIQNNVELMWRKYTEGKVLFCFFSCKNRIKVAQCTKAEHRMLTP